jgi:hypothetical protein
MDEFAVDGLFPVSLTGLNFGSSPSTVMCSFNGSVKFKLLKHVEITHHGSSFKGIQI